MNNEDYKKEILGLKLFLLLIILYSWPVFFITDAWLIPRSIAAKQTSQTLLIAAFGHLVGMLGPAFSSIILWKFFYKEALPHLVWSRFKYYIFSLMLMLSLWTLPAAIGLILGNSYSLMTNIKYYHWIFIITMLSFGWIAGVGEELGWCSFILTRMNPFLGKTKAVILSGVLRGVWHFPILIGPLLYKTIFNDYPVYLLFFMSLVFLVQLIISNVFFGSLFGFVWYKTKSYPLLGWLHAWFDIARDFSIVFIMGYASSFWIKYGWGMIFYLTAYLILSNIAVREGIKNLNRLLFTNWKNFLSLTQANKE